MGLIFDVGNGNNWVSRYDNSLQGAPAVVPGNYEPIPDLVIPITFTGHLLAISASSSTAKDSWKTAGWIWQRVLVNIGTGSTSPNATVQKKYKFYLGQVTVLTIPKLASNYGLSVSIPHWISQLSFEIYEYTGEVIDTNEQKLDQILTNLATCIANGGGGSGDNGDSFTTQQKIATTYFTNFL
ncbi:MAG: hypothetical protein AB4038_04210 [Prochloraceae cyanobacterium]